MLLALGNVCPVDAAAFALLRLLLVVNVLLWPVVGHRGCR